MGGCIWLEVFVCVFVCVVECDVWVVVGFFFCYGLWWIDVFVGLSICGWYMFVYCVFGVLVWVLEGILVGYILIVELMVYFGYFSVFFIGGCGEGFDVFFCFWEWLYELCVFIVFMLWV